MSHPFDPVSVVSGYRPTDEQLDDLWPADRRAAVFDRAQTATSMRLRWKPATLTGGLAAAAVVAVVAGVALVGNATSRTAGHNPEANHPSPASSPAVSPTRNQFVLLAARARVAPALVTGGYWHVVRHDTEDGGTAVQESWTDGRGRVWRRDTEHDGSVSYLLFAPGTGDFEDPTPRTLSHLPTDPVALERTLRAHVSGSTSTDEAVFDYVQTIVGSGWASPDLRAAALTVLQHTGRVTTSTTTDSLGRPAVRADFVDPTYRPGEKESLYFDPHSTELLETEIDLDLAAGSCPPDPPRKSEAPVADPNVCRAERSHYTETLIEQRQTASVPASVRARAVRQPR
ncbi:hypothetical protein [uncultured Jatrophihabitans sp.]|uniref:hypothetical protein n=1 Tax=uncultured Jatrophihabitans sp. TaxID=1610747 RepID=UPI0035CC82C5